MSNIIKYLLALLLTKVAVTTSAAAASPVATSSTAITATCVNLLDTNDDELFNYFTPDLAPHLLKNIAILMRRLSYQLKIKNKYLITHLNQELLGQLKRVSQLQFLDHAQLQSLIDSLMHEVQKSEVMSSENLFTRALAKIILYQRGFDFSSKPLSFDKLARHAGVVALITQTTLQSLTSILRDKELSPPHFKREHRNGGAACFIYLSFLYDESQNGEPLPSLSRVSRDVAVSDGQVKIIFSSSTLDRFHWSHVNPHWGWGKETADSYYPNYLLYHFLKRVRWEGEVLFDENIRLDAEEIDFRIIVYNKKIKNEILETISVRTIKKLKLYERIVVRK